MMLKSVFAGLVACLFLHTVAAQEVTERYESAQHRTPVLELYTSLGCSSCPPAEKWIAGFLDHPGLWKEVIPLAFHVDYWDFIGWKDRFASPAFSARQREYRSEGRVRSVYTPGFVLNGNEWKGWFRKREPVFDTSTNPGRLVLEVSGNQTDISFEPGEDWNAEALVANVAVLGFGFSTKVTAGENDGRTLGGNFVVLALAESAEAKKADYRWTVPLPRWKQTDSERYALVAWLSKPDSPSIYQATGGWFTPR